MTSFYNDDTIKIDPTVERTTKGKEIVMMESIKKKIELGKSITIKFSVKFGEDDSPDLDEMTAEQLQEYLEELENQLDNLEANEPEDDGGDAYEEWSDKRDELEDLISDVEDRLDALED